MIEDAHDLSGDRRLARSRDGLPEAVTSIRTSLEEAILHLVSLSSFDDDVKHCVWTWHLALTTLAYDVADVVIPVAVGSRSLRASRALNRMLFEYAIRVHFYIVNGAAAVEHVKESANMLRRIMKPVAMGNADDQYTSRVLALGPLLPPSVGRGKRVGDAAFESLRAKPLRDFTDTELRAFLDRQAAHGIGTRTVQVSYEALRAAWKYALQRRYVDGETPFLRVDRPHHDAKPKVSKSDTDIAKLVAAIDAVPLVRSRTLLQLLITTGLRISEALALTWESVDIDGAIPEVRVRVQLGENGEVAPLKTDESRREVFLMAHVAQGMRELRASARSQWVFETAKTSKPLDRNNVRTKMLSPVVERAGLTDRRITVHGLRGIAATILAPMVDAATLTRLFGWSSIKTAMEFYVHSSDTMREAGGDGMQKQLERFAAIRVSNA